MMYGMSGGSGYGGTSSYGQAPSMYGTQPTMNYSQPSLHNTYVQPETPHFSVQEGFLVENRPLTPIVSDMGDVKEVVEQTYSIITGEDFPEDSILIRVCHDEQFRTIYESTGGQFNEGVMGFSFNKYGKGASEIYVREDHMDRLLLTIGHEIGHVLSPPLPNASDEEAKAHAFSLAWMETIRDNDIAGLQSNISVNPARNGVHDVGFSLVLSMKEQGHSSFDVFKTLAYGLTSMLEV